MTITQTVPREIAVPLDAGGVRERQRVPARPGAGQAQPDQDLSRTPEALIDVTLQPVIFLALFTYIFGGAIAGVVAPAPVSASSCCPACSARPSPWPASRSGQNLNADIQKGVFDRFRSLPIARSAPLVGAVMADIGRYLILFVVHHGHRHADGLPGDQRVVPTLAALVLSMGFALCFGWISVFVGMMVRTPGAVQGIMFLLVLPLSFGSNTFVTTATDARLAAGLRQGQPDHATWWRRSAG